jgi:hypothetical protein
VTDDEVRRKYREADDAYGKALVEANAAYEAATRDLPPCPSPRRHRKAYMTVSHSIKVPSGA